MFVEVLDQAIQHRPLRRDSRMLSVTCFKTARVADHPKGRLHLGLPEASFVLMASHLEQPGWWSY